MSEVERVLAKLIAFAISLAIVPLTLYFASLKYIWNGNSTFAAFTAVFAANCVLVGYVMACISEDKPQMETSSTKSDGESKKDK